VQETIALATRCLVEEKKEENLMSNTSADICQHVSALLLVSSDVPRGIEIPYTQTGPGSYLA
jgi:hypothetical protein